MRRDGSVGHQLTDKIPSVWPKKSNKESNETPMMMWSHEIENERMNDVNEQMNIEKKNESKIKDKYRKKCKK